MPHIVLIGTLDTKLSEFLYLRSQLLDLSQNSPTPLRITTIDCGRSPTKHEAITISQPDLVKQYGTGSSFDFQSSPRGEIIKYMISCTKVCVQELLKKEDVHGILSAGGTGGTSLVSAVMREVVPLGMPKLIVSTVASGDTGPIVGETDITMMYSVVDIAGTNAMLRDVLGNAAGAMLGMSTAYEKRKLSQKQFGKGEDKLRVGITMFGVTTPCVDKIREYLVSTYPVEVFIFHATGHGGKAMERMIAEGSLDAVLDVTTTEICDYLMGGNMSAGPARLEAALKKGIPNIISVGATDMVNFGPKSMVPDKYMGRKLFEHNPTVTLMRTTKEECRMIGEFVAKKVKDFAKETGNVEVWLSRGGVSIIATPGQVFADEEADTALAEAIKEGLQGTRVKVVEDARDINDSGFAVELAKSLIKMVYK
ncbi:hypothetical protein N431DRAFT_417266 [Stipitochalara longipes BDJ]|nr:hypothetical protein N431DRAFT_417266 [Stipitochalara longipes BDJ]